MPDIGRLARLAVILGLASTTYILYRAWETRRARRALALQAGCKDVAHYPHQDRLWGYDLVRQRQEAIKEGRLMPLYAKQFATYGKTWEENFMGTRLINTADKENIQYIATTDHFGRNFSQRGRVGWPFTGRSVMSTDGAEWKHARNLINPTFSRAEMIPEDGQTFDIQPLFQKLVR